MIVGIHRAGIHRVAGFILGLAVFLGLAASQTVQAAGAWPERPITIISSSSAGSGPDALARALAKQLSAALGQSVIVENRPGATGAIGIQAVARAPNDGYTLLYSTASSTVVRPSVEKSVPFNVTKDLVPVAETAAGGVILVVNSEVPAKNLKELIALIKASPNQYSFGSWGNGSSGHLMMEWLKGRTGMQMAHVPYRNTTQMLTELASGVLKVGWTDPSALIPFVQAGKIRAIAISGNERAPQLPDVPTLAESGFKFDQVGWFGIFAPAGTDPKIVKRLNLEINKIQGSEEMVKLMKNLNFSAPPQKTSEEFKAIVEHDLATWSKIATDSHLANGQ
ncbi:tripartite tricarboxylate transporter substrate binding protein [Paralcaligenes sp. KSB-10]|uniref:Bug family tripartite tricarboxylate transporter substrate binding protein n=1 Tax=Paralcaligenes sp. KSB-10 TaxID=2901142 RepID=UPI001E2993C0|nr:tripartite tricarboxylate transporter substrate binding protein [Paralcaligenes sp. KSB-10]UHL63137.1 tripartite tricarboxylate transporter substrate binding protein [Paralcaligenes sp. KSB-10]